MIQLVLIFCMLATGQCVVVKPNAVTENWHTCLLQAERVANQWKDDQPDWSLVTWNCYRADGEEERPS